MNPTILLLVKAAIAAKPLMELKSLAEAVEKAVPGCFATFAISEQGQPSLRERLSELAEAKTAEIIIVPVMVPMEPGFTAWIKRAVHRWMRTWSGPVPSIHIADAPAHHTENLSMLVASLVASVSSEDITAGVAKLPEASVIPSQKRRVLVCMGGACNDAGAGQLWSHLRAEQERLKLRDVGEGMMSCKTSCLGPCNLAPVLQVWPEGTNYCGVDQSAVDQIIKDHILKGQPLTAFSYPANGKKQRLHEKAVSD